MHGLLSMYSWLRPLLFRLGPERAHAWTLRFLQWVYPSWRVNRKIKRFSQSPVHAFGLTFPNPVGLAAGMDKNGDYIDALFGLGFGFIEIGTVTPKPQSGNPQPRLFRLPQARALINRMGFNNRGVDHVVTQLKKRKVKGIVGVNIGKNLMTSLDHAVDDYRVCYQKVYPYADYVTVNISSPNTPRLRELQTELYLHELLSELKKTQEELEKVHHRRVPLLLKISPDLVAEELKEIARIALRHRIEGMVAVNTTRHRHGVEGLPHAGEEGGVSGEPLFPTTLHAVEHLHAELGQEIPIIAVGGIMSRRDAQRLLAAGARLIQIYTGLVYEGPGIVKDIIRH